MKLDIIGRVDNLRRDFYAKHGIPPNTVFLPPKIRKILRRAIKEFASTCEQDVLSYDETLLGMKIRTSDKFGVALLLEGKEVSDD